jgi:hypothetical protein
MKSEAKVKFSVNNQIFWGIYVIINIFKSIQTFSAFLGLPQLVIATKELGFGTGNSWGFWFCKVKVPFYPELLCDKVSAA